MLPERIERATIYHFVTGFYARVQEHPRLGPVFNPRLEGHWDAHFERLTDFWMTVLSGVPAYKGNPFQVHQALPGLSPDLFEDWLGLFAETARDMLEPALADHAVEKSRRIADSLQQGLFFRPASAS
ncbi:MAG: group III truncated hemoglobin [Alphaproteobacteria bacterium]|nr:MAG: group III truncated hemoglobin [Alphaproteobacteria bacterium]